MTPELLLHFCGLVHLKPVENLRKMGHILTQSMIGLAELVVTLNRGMAQIRVTTVQQISKCLDNICKKHYYHQITIK
jgi:hypothetical protein